MKKLYSIILLSASLLVTAKLSAQSVIYDREGYVNVREKADKNSKIIDTLSNGHLIYDMEKEGNWTNIDYFKNNKSFDGYIYTDRIKRIDTFREIKQKKLTETTVILENDSIQITVTEKKFEPKKHSFTYSKENKDQIQLIDRKQYYGTDGELPEFQYDEVKIKIGTQIIVLPKSATENLFQPSLYKVVAHYDKKSKTIYIDSINSDGAGSYIVVWKIKNGKYVDRYIFNGF